MTEVGWWYTGIFFVIIAVFYAIGFIAGKNWEKLTQEDLKEVVKKDDKKILDLFFTYYEFKRRRELKDYRNLRNVIHLQVIHHDGRIWCYQSRCPMAWFNGEICSSFRKIFKKE